MKIMRSLHIPLSRCQEDESGVSGNNTSEEMFKLSDVRTGDSSLTGRSVSRRTDALNASRIFSSTSSVSQPDDLIDSII